MNNNTFKFSLIFPARHAAGYILILFWLVLSFTQLSAAAGKIYPNRWVYVSRNLSSDSHIDDIRLGENQGQPPIIS